MGQTHCGNQDSPPISKYVYLQHFCDFEGGDVFGDVEVILLYQQNTATSQNLRDPLVFHPHFSLHMLDQNKALGVIICECSDKFVVAVPL